MLNNLRESLKPALERLGRAFAATGLPPNFWTALGLALALLSALAFGMGGSLGHALIIGGALLLASGFFDVVDGQVARAASKASKRGEYLDSMSDKIAEAAIFLGILAGGYAEPYLVFLAVTLSLLVSYARAKSELIGIRMQGIGIGERAERLLVLAIVGMAGFMEYAVVIVAAIAGVTLVQRMVAATRAARG